MASKKWTGCSSVTGYGRVTQFITSVWDTSIKNLHIQAIRDEEPGLWKAVTPSPFSILLFPSSPSLPPPLSFQAQHQRLR
jgi:hypothetical protein